MTKDKSGRCVFVKGKIYTPVSFFSAVWLPGVKSECLDTMDHVDYEKGGEVVPNGKGQFNSGSDIRWYVASEQFDDK